MPELPEVQTVVSDLARKAVGFVILDFWSDWGKGIRPNIKTLKQKIKNQKIISARRIGKHVILDLENKFSLVIHLKMTGHLLFKESDNQNKNFLDKVNKYIHHIFYLKNEKGERAQLDFSDLRKFGWINLVKTEEVENLAEIKKLGPDALNPDFSLASFKNILKKYPRKKIGVLILEQNLISGIGNIYRSEILFLAKVLPERLAQELSEREIKNIYSAIKKILKKAVKMRGTSDSDYRDTDGKKGNFQKVLKVYRKADMPCQICRNKIRRKKIAQRSVFYCDGCQS